MATLGIRTWIRARMSQGAPTLHFIYRVPDGSLRYRGMVSRRKRSPYLMVAAERDAATRKVRRRKPNHEVDLEFIML